MLLDCNPCLAKYSTFGGLNSPLHFASAKGHNETALMQACRYGHWEVVQTLLLYKCKVTRADYLSRRTTLHFAAVNGHVRCIRLVVSNFVPSSPFEFVIAQMNGDKGDASNIRHKHDQSALAKFVNKADDGGITALYIAALNGYFDCVQLLLNLHANVSVVTFHYGTSMDLIGAGITPLHYAACGGNLKCVQILFANGASWLTLNCNGWLPLDVARMWGRQWLEPLLAPNSELIIHLKEKRNGTYTSFITHYLVSTSLAIVLEVKVATPKEAMRAPSKKVTRIFGDRVPPSVTKLHSGGNCV